MKILAATIALALSATCFAETALRDDGREVKLNADGSWQFVSNDVLATSQSGLRVRLKEDGTWVSLEPGKAEASVQGGQIPASNLASGLLSLSDMQIQKVQENRSMSKSTVYKHNMLAKLRFSQVVDPKRLDTQYFSIKSNKGKTYPVIAVKAIDDYTVLVRAEGAPDRWSRVKRMMLVVNKSVLASLADLTVEVDFRDINTVVMSEFKDTL